MIRTSRCLIAAIVALVASSSATIAQEEEPDCIVQEAAQAALNRQVELIEAAKVDVSDFFTGESSCINNNLLNTIDFSVMIPDLAALINDGVIDAARGLMQDARNQVCEAINDQVADVVGDINGTLNVFETSLSEPLDGILSNGRTNISLFE